MAGLLIIGAAVAYVGFFLFLATKLKNVLARCAVILIPILIPFWDLPIGIVNFYQHCSRDGGIHVEKDFRLGDLILFEKAGAFRPDEMTEYGFKTIEFISRKEIIRYSATANGIVKSTDVKAISPIQYETVVWDLTPWNLQRIEQVIKQVADGKIVARRTDFSWGGVWWQKHIGLRGANWNHCTNVPQKSLLKSLRDVK